MTTRTYQALTSAILTACPLSDEITALTAEQIETLRKYGNTYDNVLLLALLRRREAVKQEQP